MADNAAPSDPYEVVLADLRSKIAQLQQAVAAIEATRGGNTQQNQDVTGQNPPAVAQVTQGMFHGMSIVESVKQLLAMRKKPLGTSEITEAITAGGVVFSTATPGNTVGSVLHREASKNGGGVISVGRGTWALPSWYPNPGRFQKKKVAPEAPEANTYDPDIEELLGESDDPEGHRDVAGPPNP